MNAKVEVKKKYPTKGRPKGMMQKLRNCQHCEKELTANMKICPSCLKPTGFWSK